MYGEVPSGQQAYVRTDGSLGFTVPHTGAVPEGAVTHPFQFTPQEENGKVGSLKFATRDFNPCKTGERGSTGLDVYKLYALSIISKAQYLQGSAGEGVY